MMEMLRQSFFSLIILTILSMKESYSDYTKKINASSHVLLKNIYILLNEIPKSKIILNKSYSWFYEGKRASPGIANQNHSSKKIIQIKIEQNEIDAPWINDFQSIDIESELKNSNLPEKSVLKTKKGDSSEKLKQFLLLYTLILVINTIFSGIIWLKDTSDQKRVKYSIFMIWLMVAISLVLQGLLTRNNLEITIGYSSLFAVNLAISDLFSQILGKKLLWKKYVALSFPTYFLSILFYIYNFSFKIVALPACLFIIFPGIHTLTKYVFPIWRKLNFPLKALSINFLFFMIHNSDYLFLRKNPDFALFGFSIALVIILSLIVTTNFAAIESSRLKKQNEKLKSHITDFTMGKIKKFVKYIDNNYNEDISIEGLAASLGINHDYLRKAFKECFGMKINDYINSLRINEAADKLKETDNTIIEIAYSVGFDSITTFNRSFKKFKGITPSNYRKNNSLTN